MNKAVLSTIVLALAAGVAGAWTWDKYGTKKCKCKCKCNASGQDAAKIISLPPPASTGTVLNDTPYQTPPFNPATNVMSFDGWRDAY